MRTKRFSGLTIKENISPSSSQAMPPRQNISNQPSLPSRRPKTVWCTSHRWSSTKFFTTFLKILQRKNKKKIQSIEQRWIYSMNRSWVKASSGNGTDCSNRPRWGRQSSNDDLEMLTNPIACLDRTIRRTAVLPLPSLHYFLWSIHLWFPPASNSAKREKKDSPPSFPATTGYFVCLCNLSCY